MSLFPPAAQVTRHCKACGVDWKDQNPACWMCGGPGELGALMMPAIGQPLPSVTCSTVEFDAPCPGCGRVAAWRSERDEQAGEHLGCRFTSLCDCSTVSTWTQPDPAPRRPAVAVELRAIRDRTTGAA